MVRTKRIDANFGYYTIIRLYIKRLKKLTSNTDGGVLKETIYALSPNKNLRDQAIKGLACELKKTSDSFLSYLSSESNQCPPKEKKEWNNNMTTLMDFLMDYSLIGYVFPPAYNEENDIKDQHTSLMTAMNEIEMIITQELK
jgi:hypothetical protein